VNESLTTVGDEILLVFGKIALAHLGVARGPGPCGASMYQMVSRRHKLLSRVSD
jgi:hypothetical protein